MAQKKNSQKTTVTTLTLLLMVAVALLFPAPGSAGEPPSSETTGVIKIEKVVTGESQILTAAEIETITAEYEGKQLTADELKAMISKLNRLYQQKGAVTARAFLPPQTVENGVLLVELVEGRVGEIQVVNNEYTKTTYILDRLALTKGEIFYLNKLETELNQFNLANDIMLIAELQAGEEYQTTDVIIKTLEPPNFQAIIFTDNQGSADTGLYRVGLNLTGKSLFGYRDPLTISGAYSKGSITASLDYQRPFRNSAYLHGGYSYSWTQIIKPGFETADIGNTGSDLYLKYGKRRVSVAHEQNKFLSVQKKQTEARIATSIIEKTDLITAVFGINQINRGNEMLRTCSHSVTGGTQEKTTFFEEKSDIFLKYNGQFHWQTDIWEKMDMTLNITGQLGLTLIPEKEQFSIGGISTVRGFDTGVKRGDHGYCLRMEFHERTPRWIKGFLFLDQGGAFLSKTPIKGSIITSFGLGLNMQFTRNITAQVVCGIPVQGKVKFHLNAQAVYF